MIPLTVYSHSNLVVSGKALNPTVQIDHPKKYDSADCLQPLKSSSLRQSPKSCRPDWPPEKICFRWLFTATQI